MLELGRYTEEAHKEVGKRVASSSVNKLIVVGERARDIAHGAQEAGMAKENIFHFSHNREAGKFIEERLEEGDLILAKGSQGARMEKIVKEIMADPLQAKDLLVRQGAEWE
jgi:UDP-N-acetylmuramoyl-tripeptide--D-alanyl-D-alanine ligase